MTMSVTLTDEQHAEVVFYLRKLRDGEPYDWIMVNGKRTKRHFDGKHHCDRLSALIAGWGSSADETEAEIRAQLLIWSQPSCP
jgi:hypothetical protein